MPKAVTKSPLRRTVSPLGTITSRSLRIETNVDPSGQETSRIARPSAIESGWHAEVVVPGARAGPLCEASSVQLDVGR